MSALRNPVPAPDAGAWMSVRAAAQALGVSRQTVYVRCVNGQLDFDRIEGGQTVISRASVERAIAERTHAPT